MALSVCFKFMSLTVPLVSFVPLLKYNFSFKNQPVPISIATYPVKCLNTPVKSELIICLTILATEPFKNEFNSRTKLTKDTTINPSEINNRSSPIVESDKSVLANKLSPVKKSN